jgi:DNA polymerase-3 subunit gamma/tau
MVLVRIAYAADLPTPDEVVRSLGGGGGGPPPARAGGNGGATAAPATQSFAPRFDAPRGAPRSSAMASPRSAPMPMDAPQAGDEQAPALAIGSFEAIIALAAEKRDITMKLALERDVRLVRFEDGQLEIALEASAPKTLVHDLQRKLTTWTGKRWIVVVSKEQGAPTLRAQTEDRDAELRKAVMQDPLVQAVLNKFPGATVGAITQTSAEADPVLEAPPEDDED